MALSIFKEINGGIVLYCYSNRIFAANTTEQMATYLTNGVVIFQLFGTIVIITIVDKFTRKKLLGFGLLSIGVLLLGFAWFSYVKVTMFTFVM